MGEDSTNMEQTVLGIYCFIEHLSLPTRGTPHLQRMHLAQGIKESFMVEVLLKDSFRL